MRCIRLWTDAEGTSGFEEGRIALKDGGTVNFLSDKFPAKRTLLAEDVTGSGHPWKLIGNDPWRRAYVI
jgi:hypothetical protein